MNAALSQEICKKSVELLTSILKFVLWPIFEPPPHRIIYPLCVSVGVAESHGSHLLVIDLVGIYNLRKLYLSF